MNAPITYASLLGTVLGLAIGWAYLGLMLNAFDWAFKGYDNGNRKWASVSLGVALSMFGLWIYVAVDQIKDMLR